MEEVINEQMEAQTQPAEAEKSIGGIEKAEISLGKFKDVNALLQAYNSLQAEFTKRCQRLKELEGIAEKTEKFGSADCGKTLEENALNGITQENKEQILKDYLKEVLNSKQKAVVMTESGVGVKTPIEKPKSIFEAGILAKEILK